MNAKTREVFLVHTIGPVPYVDGVIDYKDPTYSEYLGYVAHIVTLWSCAHQGERMTIVLMGGYSGNQPASQADYMKEWFEHHPDVLPDGVEFVLIKPSNSPRANFKRLCELCTLGTLPFKCVQHFFYDRADAAYMRALACTHFLGRCAHYPVTFERSRWWEPLYSGARGLVQMFLPSPKPLHNGASIQLDPTADG